jgi:hypothetical protein
MKELIEGLLFVALLKFLGVPMWLISLGSALFLIGLFVYEELRTRTSGLVIVRTINSGLEIERLITLR